MALSDTVDRIDAFQQRHAVVAFPVGVVRKFSQDRGSHLAALIAYYGFLSLFPLMLVLTTVLAYVLDGRPELAADLEDSALAQIPIIGDQLFDAVNPIKGSPLAIVVGVLLALWGGLGAMSAVQDALNGVWDVPRFRQPKMGAKRARSLLGLSVFGVLLVGATVLSNLAPRLDGLGPVGMALLVAASIGLNLVAFLVSFRVLTGESLPWSWHLAGAVLAGLAYYGLQTFGSWIVTTVLDSRSGYGQFAVVLVLLFWLYLLAMVTTIAAEVNVVARRHLWARSLSGRLLTDADRAALDYEARSHQLAEEQVISVDFEATPRGAPVG